MRVWCYSFVMFHTERKPREPCRRCVQSAACTTKSVEMGADDQYPRKKSVNIITVEISRRQIINRTSLVRSTRTSLCNSQKLYTHATTQVWYPFISVHMQLFLRKKWTIHLVVSISSAAQNKRTHRQPSHTWLRHPIDHRDNGGCKEDVVSSPSRPPWMEPA